MGRSVTGDVVVVPFPFSDLSDAKRRPALVVAPLPGEDVILCQITSRDVRDANAVPLRREDFVEGGLDRPSNARPNRLFTASGELIAYRAGRLGKAKVDEVLEAVRGIFKGSSRRGRQVPFNARMAAA